MPAAPVRGERLITWARHSVAISARVALCVTFARRMRTIPARRGRRSSATILRRGTDPQRAVTVTAARALNVTVQVGCAFHA